MTLSVRDLCKRYGGNRVLSGVTLDIGKGEIVSVLGPNGSGKSTLIKAVCGVIRPDSGDILSDGAPLRGMGPKELSRKIGYVPQSFVPSDYMTVFDAVLIGRAPYMSWSYSDEDLEKAEEAMDRMGIFGLSERYVNDLSGGQMQKVVLARALAQDPEYYVLDEPTSALDLKSQMVAMRTVRDAVSGGSSGALVALHDLNLAMRFCDRVAMLKDGKVYAEGPPEKTITEESILGVYGAASEILEGREGLFVHILEGSPDRSEKPGVRTSRRRIEYVHEAYRYIALIRSGNDYTRPGGDRLHRATADAGHGLRA